ncbi:hypothetical protein ACOME3_009803 [Neoechinorhynchus agilis]
MNLEKLSIRGIRSFGPFDQDVQTLKFFAPLTLIVGSNGVGKTTVIECLRYCSTGEMPPGSKQGGSFVYDLKLTDDAEVRAQVRLAFIDVSGKSVKVQRSLCATTTNKGKQVSLRTLENAISRVDGDGNACQISSKCVDVDREIVTSFGVSKAILENVIFCHQEDCNWPLGEGKVLKAKFDDIFSTTKYVKALEEIRKIRLEKSQQFKLGSVELVHLRRNRDRANEVKIQIEQYEKQMDAGRKELEELNEKLERTKSQLNSLSAKIQRYHRCHEQLMNLRSQKANIESQIGDLIDRISVTSYSEYVDKPSDEIKDMMEKHRDKIRQNCEDLLSCESAIDKLKRLRVDYLEKSDLFKKQIQSLEIRIFRDKELEAKVASCDRQLVDKVSSILKNVDSVNYAQIECCRKTLSEIEENARREEEIIDQKWSELNDNRCRAEQNVALLKRNKILHKESLEKINKSLDESKISVERIKQLTFRQP